MINFKKVFNLILIAAIFLMQDAGFCLTQENAHLRVPVAANTQEGLKRIEDAFSAVSGLDGLDSDQRELLAEVLPMIEDNYLAIKGTGFTRTTDRDKSDPVIEYLKGKGGKGVDVLKVVLEKDSRAWVRAKAAMALSELVPGDDVGTVEFLIGVASKDKSLLVRSLIVRRALEDIKKHSSDSVKKIIEERVGAINLNPWAMKDGLRVLEVGCGFGEASHGIAKYYREKGFSDLIVLGVDSGYNVIINAEKNKTDDSIVFVYGTVDETPAYFPADIVISQNLLIYREELKEHADALFSQVNKDGGTVYFSPSIFNKSDDGSGPDGIMRLFDMEKYFRNLSANIPGAGLKVTRETEPVDPFGFNFVKGAFGSPWGASTGWIECSLPSKITVNTQNSSIKIRQSRFPDGEAYIRILNSDAVKDSGVTVDCSLNSSQDLVEVVLLMDFLHTYGAKSIRLVYESSVTDMGIGSGLLEFLRLFCDAVAYKENKEIKELPIAPPDILVPGDKVRNAWIYAVAYQHDRLKQDAIHAAGLLSGAKHNRINVIKNSPNPLNWTVEIDPDFKGKNIAFLHSTENSVDIAELWMILIALRKTGVKSVHVFNAYEGYSRQDKIFNKGEGVSASTMLKAMDGLTDSHFALNVHYLDRTGLNTFSGIDVYNINAFIQIAEHQLDFIVKSLKGRNLEEEFKKHPIVLLAPDDGAFQYVKEARARLSKYIREKYNINIPVHCGYMDKKRISGTEVEIKGNILENEGKPIKGIDNIKDCWMLIIDDETSSGGTLLTATYVLNQEVGVAWHRILTGVVHGKLAMGLKPFETGLTEDDILQAIERGENISPKQQYINISKKHMPARIFICTSSVQTPDGFSEERNVPIWTAIAHFIKKALGRNISEQILEDVAESRTQI